MEYGHMLKSRPLKPLNTQIRSEATEWLLCFSEGEVSAPEREEFNDWLRTSPEHVRAYLRVSAFWQEADRIGAKHTPGDIAALVARAKAEANVFPLEFSPHPSVPEAAGRMVSPERARGPRRLYWSVAATLLLAIGAAVMTWYTVYADPIYSTDIGERRTVNLPDGSTVTLNADSSIKVAYTDRLRAIELREGQALFKVAKNPSRPFIVRSGGTHIRAVGTQFDVYKKEIGTIVTVVEGKVAIDARANAPTSSLLVAGEQLTVFAERRKDPGAPLIPQPVKVSDATAWTSGLLVFDGAPLSEVVREFNRQNTKPLILSGDELNELKISGTFPANGSHRLVLFLKERFQVTVRETNEGIEIFRP